MIRFPLTYGEPILAVEPGLEGAGYSLRKDEGLMIRQDGQPLQVYVGAADEETWIARETMRCLRAIQ